MPTKSRIKPTHNVRTTGRSKPAAIKQTPAANLGDSPVTITVAQLNDLQAQARDAQTAVMALTKQLADARTADPTGRVGNLAGLARQLLIVARFAFANLPPIAVPKWPWQAVGEIAIGLKHLPDYTEDDDVLVNELQLFVADVKEHELARARKRDELIASAPSEILRTLSSVCDHVFCDANGNRVYSMCQRGCGTRDPLAAAAARAAY